MSAAAERNDWPDGLLLAYYGDDFTGSTDAMEAMTAAGVPTVLFLDAPAPGALQRFPDARCVGIAGSSRGRSPQWMDAELPKAFAALTRLGAPILHYKVCSTFDSSPAIGSIGHAIDIGVAHMPGRWTPTIVGAPRLKRYQAFGNLFAAVDGVGYRLDRHPTMSRHPVTPMHEADLRRHLGAQTRRPIELIDMVQLRQGTAEARQRELEGDAVPVVLIDVLDDETLREAGGVGAAGAQPIAQCAGDRRHQHVVDRATESGAQRLDVGQRDRFAPGDALLAGDAPAQRRRRVVGERHHVGELADHAARLQREVGYLAGIEELVDAGL